MSNGRIPHRRYNPLSNQWVVVSPHRATRPWQGQTEAAPTSQQQSFDPTCYLCPRNTRANGEKNPDYQGVYIFDNDFPALLAEAHSGIHTPSDLFQQQTIQGICRVLCFSHDHSKTLSNLDPNEIIHVISAWAEQFALLSNDYAWVQLFENKGVMMGCSNPHPHGQIWATSYIPTQVDVEEKQQQQYFLKHHRPLLSDYAQQELEREQRIVMYNQDWLVVVPYWAQWPFETLLLPRFHCPNWAALTPSTQASLAEMLQRLSRCYDALFNCNFPYSMGWHCAPANMGRQHWQLHAHFYPPLLRNQTIRKFMVGFEMLCEAQRDLTPEQAAISLRES